MMQEGIPECMSLGLQGRAKHAETSLSAAQKAVTAAKRSLAETRQQLEAERNRCSCVETELKQAESKAAETSSAAASERAHHEAARQELQDRLWRAQDQVRPVRICWHGGGSCFTFAWHWSEEPSSP